jgi:hypothetical protein
MRVLVFLGLWRSADFCKFSVIFLAESLPLIEDHFGGVMLLASWAIITVFPHLLFGMERPPYFGRFLSEFFVIDIHAFSHMP